MIIDVHGHYTTAPKALETWRNRQIAGITDPSRAPRVVGAEDQRRRDPRDDRGEPAQTDEGARIGPDDLQPARELHGPPHRRLPGVVDLGRDLQRALLPGQPPLPGPLHSRRDAAAEPGRRPGDLHPRARRCVEQYGAVAINLNPDPSGGHWTSPPLTDRHWYPIYERMVEHDIPAMIHVSTSCNACFHTTGAHYINADTTAFMQLHPGRPVQGLPDAALRHPARRRRRALPLGALPRPRAGAEEAAARGAPAEQRLLRHLRLPPARHRSADHGRAGREHPVRQRDDRRRARHRSRDRPQLRRHQALHRGVAAPDAGAASSRSTKATPGASIRASTPRSSRGK